MAEKEKAQDVKYFPEFPELQNAAFPKIMAARDAPENQTPEVQNILALLEHQAFARNVIKDSPIIGTLGLIPATIGYNLGKKTGLVKARSESNMSGDLAAVLRGMFQGYTGFTPPGGEF